MSYAYAQRRRESPAQTHTFAGRGETASSIPNSARLAMLESGAASPTAEEKGRRVDLGAVMRQKMEKSFGMDLSSLKLYESRMVADAGANAVTRGNEIMFAPGKLDVSSRAGQALLGHEVSHVASQARGEVHGRGFLLDGGLEARADREGAMAARGESVYGGAVAPLSSASAAPMAGPMQASKPEDPKAAEEKRQKAYLKKASQFAKLQAKRDKLRAGNKELGGRDFHKYSNLMNEAQEGGSLYRALHLKRNEKRRKEMQMAPGSNYHSQDRYDSAIKAVQADLDDTISRLPYSDYPRLSKKREHLGDVGKNVQEELGNDYVWDHQFDWFREDRDGGGG